MEDLQPVISSDHVRDDTKKEKYDPKLTQDLTDELFNQSSIDGLLQGAVGALFTSIPDQKDGPILPNTPYPLVC